MRLNPFATWRAKGILWANGSDFGVTPYAARYGIWSAVSRETLLGTWGDPFGRAESVDVRTALRAVTIWAARQMFLEQKIGSIEVGKYADLAVWDRDPYTVATAALKDMRCLMTLFNGKIACATCHYHLKPVGADFRMVRKAQFFGREVDLSAFCADCHEDYY